ncbi:hypothetical protein AVEN_210437-1 [Araneus ventricosus]|uniref:Uncharacterized protein n=1 Tax=Araneus ventricosus TaxID=182803 RepID=A0A4Y2HVF9_ARAVE|nr:hypothetical protein AVEN_210437-1 [Araneus ventricosus]
MILGDFTPSPLRNFLSSYVKLSAGHILLWWRNLLLNKLSRIKIAKLTSFLTDNADLIKQQPDATSSSVSDTDFSPSPRPQIDGPLPSRYQGL